MDRFEINETFTAGYLTEIRDCHNTLHRYVTLYNKNNDVLVLNIIVNEVTGECTYNTPNPAEVTLNW